MMTDLELAAQYAVAAEAWRAFAQRPADADPMGESVVVVLLAGLCEPPPYAPKFTGDLLADVLGGLRGFVDRLDQDAAEGGGARAVVHGPRLRRGSAGSTARSRSSATNGSTASTWCGPARRSPTASRATAQA
jgi:hypothetical protein